MGSGGSESGIPAGKGARKSAARSLGNGSADGALKDSPVREIEGTYREARGWSPSYYKEEILEATTDGNGNLTFDYATPVKREKTAKTNRSVDLIYEIAHGAVDGRTFGINWDKVQSIQGQTYKLREEAKAHGLKWDRERKIWAR